MKNKVLTIVKQRIYKQKFIEIKYLNKQTCFAFKFYLILAIIQKLRKNNCVGNFGFVFQLFLTRSIGNFHIRLLKQIVKYNNVNLKKYEVK